MGEIGVVTGKSIHLNLSHYGYWVAPWVESKVHVALRVDWEVSVDSEDSNMEQDGIELLHK